MIWAFSAASSSADSMGSSLVGPAERIAAVSIRGPSRRSSRRKAKSDRIRDLTCATSSSHRTTLSLCSRQSFRQKRSGNSCGCRGEMLCSNLALALRIVRMTSRSISQTMRCSKKISITSIKTTTVKGIFNSSDSSMVCSRGMHSSKTVQSGAKVKEIRSKTWTIRLKTAAGWMPMI